jgi:16S rRNA (guanine(966)-N(2))-methyltransferase RsmD
MPNTRPTTDLAKEGLFNILENNLSIADIKTLDLFGGTGSITYELASRGAVDLTIVEKDPKMYEFIKNNIREFQIENCKVVKSDVFRFLENCIETYDLIFADPPYAFANTDDLPRIVRERNLLKKNGWFVLEHTSANNYENELLFKTKRNYGSTIFSIFVNS